MFCMFIHNIKPHRFKIILPILAYTVFYSLTYFQEYKKNYSNPLFNVHRYLRCVEVQCSVIQERPVLGAYDVHRNVCKFFSVFGD